MSFLAKFFKGLAGLGVSGNLGCMHFWLDEPTMPKSMIEK